MKKLIAVVLLAAGLIVVPGSNTATAATGCGWGYFPPAYGNPGWGYGSCSTLAAGEKVRGKIWCSTGAGYLDPNGWKYGPWTWNPEPQLSKAYCTMRYPYVYYIAYELGVGP